MKIDEPDWVLFLRHNIKKTMLVELAEWFRINIAGKELYDPSKAVEFFGNERGTWSVKNIPGDVSKALMINIEPLEKDTSEKFIRDFCKAQGVMSNDCFNTFVDRAEKLKVLK